MALNWTITKQSAGKLRFAVTANLTAVDLTKVVEGDYVNIYGAMFNSINRGTFTIVTVNVVPNGGTYNQYFEVVNLFGVNQSASQLVQADMSFWRPTTDDIQNGQQTTTVNQSGTGSFDVVIPATSSIVNRDSTNAAYLAPTIAGNPTLNYINLPGTTGYASTPDSVATSVTGDIDLRIKLAANDWTPSLIQYPLAKYNAPATGTFLVSIAGGSGGLLGFSWIETSGVVRTVASTVAPTVSDGQAIWLRVTLDVNNDAGGHVVTFYTSPDGAVWTQLGATRNAGAFTTAIFDGSDSFNVGAYGNTGSGSPFAGKVYYAEMRNGIDGTVVASFNAQDAVAGSTSFVSTRTGETWTVNPSASIQSVAADQAFVAKSDNQGVVTINTTNAHGLGVGDKVMLSNIRLNPFATPSVVYTSTSTGQTSASYSPVADTVNFSRVNSLAVGHAMVAMPGDKIAILAGGNGSNEYGQCTGVQFTTGTTEANGAKHYAVGTFSIPNITSAKKFHSAVYIPSGALTGSLFVHGGHADSTGVFTDSQLWDGIASSWTTISSPTGLARSTIAFTPAVAGGSPERVYIVGGLATSNTLSAAALYFDTNTRTFTSIASMSTTRFGHAMGLMNNGYPFVAGGATGAFGGSPTGAIGPLETAGTKLFSCEYYNGTTWVKTSDMTYARCRHILVPIGNKGLLCVGGIGYNPRNDSSANQNNYVKTCEFYDFNDNKWHYAGDLPDGMSFPIWYIDGNQIHFFSRDSNIHNIYHISSGAWTSSMYKTVTMATPPYGGVTTDNRKVLLFGTCLGATATSNVSSWVAGYETANLKSVNGQFTVASTPSSTQFTINTSKYGFGVSTVEGSFEKVTSNVAGGSFVYDPKTGLALTAIETTSTISISGNLPINILNVTDASQFPSSGYLVIGLGTTYEARLVPYLDKISNTQLIIDPRYIFKFDIASGVKVTYVASNRVYDPDNAPASFWGTDSPAGRLAAQKTIKDISASGMAVNINVVYPSDVGLGRNDKLVIWGSGDTTVDKGTA